VIWSTIGIIYAGQRLATWSERRKALVTRAAVEACFELPQEPMAMATSSPALVEEVGSAASYLRLANGLDAAPVGPSALWSCSSWSPAIRATGGGATSVGAARATTCPGQKAVAFARAGSAASRLVRPQASD
jgi:hypothetical protein